MFWEKIYNLFKSNNLEITLKLKHLIFGYKISDKDYYDVNYFITILGFMKGFLAHLAFRPGDLL
jgi:hypothetical protein